MYLVLFSAVNVNNVIKLKKITHYSYSVKRAIMKDSVMQTQTGAI